MDNEENNNNEEIQDEEIQNEENENSQDEQNLGSKIEKDAQDTIKRCKRRGKSG